MHIALAVFAILSVSCMQNDLEQESKRDFISHRGVHLKYEVAGENSIEAIRLCRPVGFTCIETDVRKTADGVMVVMHDNTLNRTCLNSDGSEISDPVYVGNCTLAQLKTDYILRCNIPERRTDIPTLEEYLEACREENLLVFIEPKLRDSTGSHYMEIISMADSILGRNNYVFTSNNFANRILRRKLKEDDVRIMDILYKTTYEDFDSLGNAILAVSTSRFSSQDYSAYVQRGVADGYLTESHADSFRRFDMINNSDVRIVSTDLMVPDYTGQGTLLYENKDNRHERISSDLKALNRIPLGAIWLDMSFAGRAKIKLGNEEFKVESVALRPMRHQLMISNDFPVFEITDKSDNFQVSDIKVRVAEFEVM